MSNNSASASTRKSNRNNHLKRNGATFVSGPSSSRSINKRKSNSNGYSNRATCATFVSGPRARSVMVRGCAVMTLSTIKRDAGVGDLVLQALVKG